MPKSVSGKSIMIQAILIAVLAMDSAFSAAAETVYRFSPATGAVPVALGVEKTLPAEPPDDTLTRNGLTFNLYYMDIRNHTHVGFANDAPGGPDAQNRLKEVLQYIGDTLNTPGTLDVLLMESETDGAGYLAYAGTYYSGAPGFQPGASLYRLTHGSKPFGPTYEEIFVVVDFGRPWNLGTGAPGGGQVDFMTVMLHEITHGLGFVSLSNSTGGSQIAPNVYSVLDQFVARRTGMVSLFGGSPPSFVGNLADLTSNDLAWSGPAAFAHYGQGVAPGVYAPATWAQGSSLSHWNTGHIVGGAVMEHAIAMGVMRRQWAPVDIGGLIDIGFVGLAGSYHSADQDQDNQISLSELLRVIQFFNSAAYHCAENPGDTEDGYIPGTGANHSCAPHASDYNPQNWVISLSELLRLIQFFNSGGYHACPGEDPPTEDGFCVGLLK